MAVFGSNVPEPDEHDKPQEKSLESIQEEQKLEQNDKQAAVIAQADKDAFKAILGALVAGGPPKKPGQSRAEISPKKIVTKVTQPIAAVDATDIAISKPGRIKRPRRGAAKKGAASVNPKPQKLDTNLDESDDAGIQ